MDEHTALRDTWYGAATPAVRAFLAQLRRLPVDRWRQLAEADGHMADRSDGADARARRTLRAVLDTMPAVARRIRAAIDRDIAVVEAFTDGACAAMMRRAARIAAGALAGRPLLSREDFERLYRPFAEAIRPRERGP